RSSAPTCCARNWMKRPRRSIARSVPYRGWTEQAIARTAGGFVRLQVKRLDDRLYETLITRSDGVSFLVKAVGHMKAIPHDLAHYAVERGLRIRGGFWGSVADGALFASLTHVGGRRKPHAEQRSKDVLRKNKGELTEVEVLVGLFNQAMEEGL